MKIKLWLYAFFVLNQTALPLFYLSDSSVGMQNRYVNKAICSRLFQNFKYIKGEPVVKTLFSFQIFIFKGLNAF